MNQNIYITRKDNWHNTSEEKDIALTEWMALAQNDPEMELHNYTEVILENGECFRYENPGAAIWQNPHPGENGKKIISFDFVSGNILVTEPDEAGITKMKHIAFKLGAKVQDEEGYIYRNEEIYATTPRTDVRDEKKYSQPKTTKINPGFLRLLAPR